MSSMRKSLLGNGLLTPPQSKKRCRSLAKRVALPSQKRGLFCMCRENPSLKPLPLRGQGGVRCIAGPLGRGENSVEYGRTGAAYRAFVMPG